jgi:NitT/TauT family transport system substrate-binding protein
MGKQKKIVIVLLILLIGIGAGSFYAYRLFSGAGKKYPSVRLAQCKPSVYKLPHYLAIEKSFYKNQKIKIKTVNCKEDREALAALESGKADVALVSPFSLILTSASGLRKDTGPVAFASLDAGATFYLVSAEDKPLEDIQSLKKKVIIAGSPDSYETILTEHILRTGGLSPYDTTAIITNIPGEIRLGALKAGIGHYLLLKDEDMPAAAARGFYRTKSFKTDFPSHVCVTTREFMALHPDALQRFTNALYMAQIWIKYHTAAETAAALKNTHGIDKNIFPALVESCYINGGFCESPAVQEKNMDTAIQMLEKSREIPMPVSSRELVDGEIAQNAVKTVKYIPEDKQEGGLQRLKFWQGLYSLY